ncbi:ubiquitin fusion degradation protein [Coniosporium tulheliwenetii]|uniref:Ubiquitin fusion degradation protein n=1 Tax=Coniosporium tulheliwenetii TaxID=3383036 RepID=A0ACC2Z5J4_9PEZI|nr:ubiquitin fusion degradation protein [Cladosporium sp. JES 115]
MSYPGYYDPSDPMSMYQYAMAQRRAGGMAPRRFDEYFRCYPVAMMPGPERESANHGGKIFLPPSALDKLTRMHITYPMLFELINGAKEKVTHAGVLEFIAEEGKVYLPYWLMQTLLLSPGDLVQIKSTDLPRDLHKTPTTIPSFLDISDPKAVLETAFRNFSCLTTGDIFTFSYNDSVYSIAVLETRPENPKKAICTLETDLSVDFAPPVGYEEPKRTSGTSTPRSSTSTAGNTLAGKGGPLHPHGTMAAAINYAAIAPSSTTAAQGAKAVSSNFGSAGHKLSSRRGLESADAEPVDAGAGRETNGPQPLRLPPGKLFLGYEVVPVKKKGAQEEEEDKEGTRFAGQGQTLRRKKGDK